MRRRPWVIATALALLGAAGATAVYFAGSRISASDREAIVGWERAAAAIVERPRALLDRLTSLAEDLPDHEAEDGLRRARRAFVVASGSLANVRAPSILRRADAEVAEFLTRAAEAIAMLLTSVQPNDSAVVAFDAMVDEARERYQRARETLIRLRCRARLPTCENTVLIA